MIKKITTKNKIVVYEHKYHPLNLTQYLKLNNSSNFEDVIEFLSSSEIIITNTYHGVYWGTLLNKKVLIINPFSTKFDNLRYPHKTIVEFQETDLLDLTNYPDALEECRKANLKFAQNVLTLIN